MKKQRQFLFNKFESWFNSNPNRRILSSQCVNIAEEYSEEYSKDLASTTAYIYSEIMESPLFFSNIDKAIDIAKAFISDNPTGTDWERTPHSWEETLYNFYVANYGI